MRPTHTMICVQLKFLLPNIRNSFLTLPELEARAMTNSTSFDDFDRNDGNEDTSLRMANGAGPSDEATGSTEEEVRPEDAAGTEDRLPQAAAIEFPAEVVPDSANEVHLPSGVSLENAEIRGQDLVLIQADGSEIVIKNAAMNVPTFYIDNVLIPQEALVAALGESGINIAAGPNGTLIATDGEDSSGANFF